jgi:hypothetical protein
LVNYSFFPKEVNLANPSFLKNFSNGISSWKNDTNNMGHIRKGEESNRFFQGEGLTSRAGGRNSTSHVYE